MSLDFVLTHFYRLVVHDFVLLSDVYWFYSKGRPEGKTVEEFAEILSGVLEIESQNFEEINTAKLSIVEKESVVLIIWDYFLDVILKHFLDDASQFPFWASKVIVTGQPHKFGLPILRAYADCLKNIYTTRGVRGLFEGCGPYVLASCYHNYKFLVKATHAFVANVFSKLPQHPSAVAIDDELASPPAAQAGRKRIAPGTSDSSDAPGTTTDSSSSNGSALPSGRPRSGTGPEALRTLSRARKSSISDLSNLPDSDGSPVNPSLSSAKERAKDEVHGAGNNGIQMVYNLAPEYSQSSGTGAGTGTGTSATTETPSTKGSGKYSHMGSVQSSGIWSLGGSTTPSYSKGLTFGGPSETGILTADGAPAGYLRANARRLEEGPYSSVAALRAKKSTQPPRTPPSFTVRLVEKGCVALMTHPLMSLAVAMVTDSTYFGQNSVFAFFRMTASRGIAGLYSGFRSRLVLSLLPLSPVVLLGVADMVIYRRMEGQGTMDSTGGVMSVIREITSEGSVLNLFNYGLLTAAHAVPGFFSFVAMRSFSWMFLGSSLQRKHQITRREDIVKAHISLIDKKAPYE